MTRINEILSGGDIATVISELKKKSYIIPEWSKLIKDYEPTLHKIVNDKQGRQDKPRSGGRIDRAARLTVGLEKLLTKRITEFTFAIPVKRIYSNIGDNDTRKKIATAIEEIYNKAHINTENIKRGEAYYASCEIFTLWYTVESKTNAYNFDSPFKLKCRTFSPMNGCQLFPMFDETGDMIAMSIEYTKEIEKNFTTTYFEVFTEDKHIKWKLSGKSGVWEVDEQVEGLNILKIPGAYAVRPKPIFDGLQPLREDLEYTLSRNSDVVAYNSAPILVVKGELKGEETKGESRRVYRVEEGGGVSYVSWSQSDSALKYHIENLLKFFWMQSQMPDISFENMKSLGDIGYDSRRTLLTDAHLKIGEEGGPLQEFLQRECNVIKAFLKKMNTSWANEVDNVVVEHVITPFIIEDEQAKLDYHMKANGGNPVESQRESIQRIGKSKNPDETIKEINEEITKKAELQAKASASAMEGMFSAE